MDKDGAPAKKAASTTATNSTDTKPAVTKGKKKKGDSQPGESSSSQKRRCISTACVACRKRKSKCDGALPSCAACASVYRTECVYDPNSDHRRKGVYRDKVDSSKAKQATLQTLLDAIIHASDDDVTGIVKKIRNCGNLDTLAQELVASGHDYAMVARESSDEEISYLPEEGERDLAGKMGELRLENGSVRYIGGTSHLIYVGDPNGDLDEASLASGAVSGPITSWTDVTNDIELITHLMNMYFTYHYPYFTTLSRILFWREFMKGYHSNSPYCSPLLVNAMLALGCHFTSVRGACAIPGDTRTKGDHFFAEAKRLTLEDDSFGKPHIATVQALALMSVREAGCAREPAGWVYSGMSFRMAQDIGLNLELTGVDRAQMSDDEMDARRMTFWGCFFFDKCWSNYLGRLPQLPRGSCNVPKFDVFPDEDSAMWIPMTAKGFDEQLQQPARIRAVARQLISLSEISSDLLLFFYHPNHLGRSGGKTAELKKLGELHKRLEEWRKDLPAEFEPKDGQLPNVLLMHMFFHLQFIHLFRPFLKYSPNSSPLPNHISPRRICTANAGAISKLMRLYKKSWNLRQICNIAVYMIHSACTIHLLNLPEKTAKRDVTHGVKHLEEIAEDWLCARRTLNILSVLARKWNCELPEEAKQILERADEKYGHYSPSDIPSPRSSSGTAEDRSTPSIKQEYSPSIQQNRIPQHSHESDSPNSIDGRIDSAISQTAKSQHQPQMQAQVQAQSQPYPHHVQHPQSMAQQQPPPLQHQQPHMAQASALPISTAPMNFAPNIMDSWPQQLPQATPQTMYNTGVSAGSGVAPLAHQMAGLPQTSSIQSSKDPGLDNNQWLLTDSARWHRNFEGWEMSYTSPTSATASTSFMFGDEQAPADFGYIPTGVEDSIL